MESFTDPNYFDNRFDQYEYYCVQKAVTVVRFSKEVKRPAILASIAEDDGPTFQYPAFICGQGEVRLLFRTDAGAGNYLGKGFPFFFHLPWGQFYGSGIRANARHLEKNLPVECEQVHIFGTPRVQNVQGMVEIRADSYFP